MANIFNEDGTYIKTEWKAGDRITINKLNKIEESLEAINDNDISRHAEADARLDALEEDREDYATKNYVSAEIAKAQLEGEEIDLSGFATKDEIPTRVSELRNDKNFLSSVPSEYVTETELKDKGYLTAIPSEYITETELNNKGYLTEHQSLANYATKDEIPTKTSQLTNDSGFLTSVPSEYITETELNNKGYLTEHQSLANYATKSYVGEEIAKAQLEGEEVDLSVYATKDELPTKTSQLTNDSGFLTSVPSEYITETELNNKGYLTEHQSLANYATKDEIPTKVSDLENDKGYLTEHQSLANYATKAEIPTNISQLTNDSGFLTSIPSEYVTDTELNDKGYLTEHQSLANYATKDEIPTKVSDLENDKGYLTEHQSLANYATKSYVDEAINALRTELMALINSGDSGGGNKTPIDLSETYPIVNSYLYSDGKAYDDSRGRGMYNIPLRDYTDFYITATSLYSATIMVIYDPNGSVLGYKGKDAENGATWTDEHIVVSDLLEEYPTASSISLSSFSLSSANTTLIVYATPV